MGDRNNPIKFGPEWLRNLSRERSAATSTSNGSTSNNTINQNAAMNAGTGTSPATPGPSAGGTTPTNPLQGNTFNNTNTSKVLLAKLRYGREEMLALYDRNSEAPPELKTIDMLYQPRGKPPSALNSTFEEERDTLRNVAPIGSLSLGERFILGRGVGRGLPPTEGRGRGRGTFVRQPSTGRAPSWHTGNPRMPGYSGGADEEPTPPTRTWSNNAASNPNNNRTPTDQAEWQATKMYRNKRPGSNTNWRQSTRDEGDEWRSDLGRSRPQDKWDRDWGERAAQDKQSSWNSNRRTWGGDSNNEENLPEWAMDGTEACGGTFDSSGAFHGYSNDDSNLPKSQESAYPLMRSHTHGSCVRQKTMEEGSEEWWASEKAKKLSPKRFDAGDIKFKKTPSVGVAESGNSSSPSTSKSPGNKEEQQEIPQKDTDSNSVTSNSPQPFLSAQEIKNGSKSKFTESKTFDALMRSDINLEETSDERGNFQSVMITPNNSLRQKHQNIVSPVNEVHSKHSRKPGILRLPRSSSNPSAESSLEKVHKNPEDKIVEDIFDMALEDKEIMPNLPISTNDSLLIVSNASSSALAQGMSTVSQTRPQLQNPMQMGLGGTILSNQGMSLHQTTKTNHPVQGMQSASLQSMQPIGITNSALNASLGLPLGGNNMGMPLQGVPPPVLPSPGLGTPGMNTPGMGSSGLGTTGMGNTILGTPGMGTNAVLGTPGMINTGMGTPGMVNTGMGTPGMGNPGLGSTGMGNPGLGTSALQASLNVVGMQAGSSGIPGFPSGLSGMSTNPNIGSNSLFMGQNTGNSVLQSANEMQMQNHGAASSFFQLHALQHSGSQGAFGSSIYGSMMQQNPRQAPPTVQNLSDQWYYEDPKKIIQGPFSSKDMYNWYRAGFFSPSLMVRRVCDSVMRPLGSYGPIVPFASQLDLMPFQMSGGPHDNMLNTQQSLGLDVESLWGQPSTSSDLMWMQHAINSRNENRVNNLPMYFWDQQPSAIASNSLLPEEIAKEMKTEDEILAQLRANQSMGSQQTLPFLTDQSAATPNTTKSDDNFPSSVSATPNLEELEKLMQKDKLISPPLLAAQALPVVSDEQEEPQEPKPVSPKPAKPEPTPVETKPQPTPVKTTENKFSKQAKSENEKTTKNKETTSKSKSKKAREEKKEELVETKNKEKEKEKDKEKEKEKEREKEKDKEESKKTERKRSTEPSPSLSKKEEKSSKKDLEKEKKEWIKEGFTLVKGSEKNVSKESKKKAEEVKMAEETERKRKEEEKQAAEEEKKKKQADTIKKQQELQLQQQRQAVESAIKKAPWSAVNNQGMQAMNKDGLTLAEIQRLEREKKVEQIKEQQQMMQIIAQQQAAALAREQELQAGLGWAKKKTMGMITPGHTLAEIQAEARKQAAAVSAAATAAAAAQALEEAQALQPLPLNNTPWGSSHNGSSGGGFWDTLPNQPIKHEKIPEPQKVIDVNKIKKKPQPIVSTPVKKEITPAADFEHWCTVVLNSWSSKIDVPTFIGFLKDIESPYEVKDYVKCYLGETKESSDFARQFLERRSKLLRVGMVTPSDDLCSPAMAINPRTNSGSDYQEVKGKGKKTKKNKMLKVDARILGFSVTAAEDRINVGDIDTA